MMFKANVIIPEHIIREIGMEIVRRQVEVMRLHNAYVEDIIKIRDELADVVESVAKDSSLDHNWVLSEKAKSHIAHLLEEGDREGAEKAFRYATNVSKIEAAGFMSNFEDSPWGAALFLGNFP